MIEFRGVEKRFGDRVILGGVDLRIESGETFFIVGASGVGKSVLIKQLVGFMRPDAGQVFIDGTDVSAMRESELLHVRKECAMVFQHSTLFDSMNCQDNVALPIRKHGKVDRAHARVLALDHLEAVGMKDYAAYYPAELGDGMRKRVAIARALTLSPKYVLFDEPTTSLDPVSARQVDRLIRDLSGRLGVTSVVVSHDLRSIFSVADRIAMLYQGHVHFLGNPEQMRASDDGVVRQFISGRAEGPMVFG